MESIFGPDASRGRRHFSPTCLLCEVAGAIAGALTDLIFVCCMPGIVIYNVMAVTAAGIIAIANAVVLYTLTRVFPHQEITLIHPKI